MTRTSGTPASAEDVRPTQAPVPAAETRPAEFPGAEATAAEAPAPPAETPPPGPGVDGRLAQPEGGSAQAVEAAEALAPGIPRLARIIGTVVAPTTLLTSLLFFFGWSHANYFFDYFGVNPTVLGLTSTDYVLRSVDALWVPMTVAACAGLVLVWGHQALHRHITASTRPGLLRAAILVMAVAGLLLASAGLWSVVGQTVLRRHLLAAPLSLASGVLLLVYTGYLLRLSAGASGQAGRAPRPPWIAVATWAGVFVLVGLSLFWAASDYSTAVGTSRAHQVVRELPTAPDAVVYSERSLSLAAPGVHEVRCRDPQAAYRFRYDGLKLVMQSGGQYLLLPETWSRTNGVAIVLPRTDSLRLEFVPAAAHAAVRNSAC